MNTNHLTEKVLDIRAFVLQKNFWNSVSTNKNDNWCVLGNYDSLSINQIDVEQSNSSPMQKMQEEADRLSRVLDGGRKIHLQFGLHFGEKKKIDSFWSVVSVRPLLVVSVIHAKRSISNEHNLEFVRSLNSSIHRIEKLTVDSNTLDYIVYNSLDCCDAIVIWSTNSYEDVIRIIEKLYEKYSNSISDIFSIYGYQSELSFSTPFSKSLEQRWTVAEPTLPALQFSLRGPSLIQTKRLAHKVESYLRTEEKCTTTCYIVAGEEDVLITANSVSPHGIIHLFKHNGILDTEQLNKQKTVCRTNICFDLKQDQKAACAIFALRSLEYKKKDYLKNPKQFRKKMAVEDKDIHYATLLTQKIKGYKFVPYITESEWYSAFCELTQELSNIEGNHTYFDIYVQEVFCQHRFFEYLKTLSTQKKSNMDLVNEAQKIHHYLHGWSQLSFHAMHAEWQLTQSFDSNRLYIYPAKLGLFYSAYLYEMAKLLNQLETSEKSIDETCAFFLTPKLGIDPHFYPIYVSQDGHTLLVQGEIPSHLLFSPAKLLPVLSHEVAHHVGHNIRNRKKRLGYIISATVLTYISRCYSDHPLFNHLSKANWRKLMEYISNTTLKNLHCDPSDDFRIEYTEQRAKKLISYLEDESKLNIHAFVREQLLLLTSDELLQRLNYKEVGARNKVGENELTLFMRGIHILFRETFADLCMCKVLDMDRAEYLTCFSEMFFANKLDVESGISDFCTRERCIVMLKIISKLQSNEDNKLADILELESDNPLLSPLAKQVSETLINVLRTNKSNPSDRIHQFLGGLLYSYLDCCQQELNVKDNPLRKIYKAFLNQKEKIVFDVIYNQCSHLAQGYISEISNYLNSYYSQTL